PRNRRRTCPCNRSPLQPPRAPPRSPPHRTWDREFGNAQAGSCLWAWLLLLAAALGLAASRGHGGRFRAFSGELGFGVGGAGIVVVHRVGHLVGVDLAALNSDEAVLLVQLEDRVIAQNCELLVRDFRDDAA